MSFIQATLRHHVSCNNGSEQPSEGANCVCCDATVANWEQKKIFDVENASHTDHRRAAGLKHVLVYVSWSFKKISCENNTALLRTKKLSAIVRYCLHFEFTSNWVWFAPGFAMKHFCSSEKTTSNGHFHWSNNNSTCINSKPKSEGGSCFKQAPGALIVVLDRLPSRVQESKVDQTVWDGARRGADGVCFAVFKLSQPLLLAISWVHGQKEVYCMTPTQAWKYTKKKYVKTDSFVLSNHILVVLSHGSGGHCKEDLRRWPRCSKIDGFADRSSNPPLWIFRRRFRQNRFESCQSASCTTCGRSHHLEIKNCLPISSQISSSRTWRVTMGLGKGLLS